MKSVVAVVSALLVGGLAVPVGAQLGSPATDARAAAVSLSATAPASAGGRTASTPTTSPTPSPRPTILAPPQQGPAPQAPEVRVRASRIGGRDRTALSVAISRAVFPRGARVAYLASSTNATDALLAGQLTDGPVLLVSPTGAGAATARAEVARTRATTLIAIGTSSALPARTLTAATPSGVRTARLAGADSQRTARAVAARAFPRQVRTAYVVGARGLADAAVSGQLTDGPILLATAAASPTAGLQWRARPRVVAVGGPSAVADTVLASARASGATTSRLDGGTPAGTAVATARRQFPTGTATAYLVPAGDLFTAALSGGLRDGVVLLAPTCGQLSPALRSALQTWRPDRIVALGSGAATVCAATMSAAAAAARS